MVAIDRAADAETVRRGRRRPSRPLTGVLALLALTLGGFAVLRLLVSGVLGADGGRYTTALLALTPYAALFGLLLAVLTLSLRRWWTGAVTLVLAIALTAVLAPRYFADEQPPVGGPTLRVLAINLYFGEADADAIVRLVREHRVDVLSLVELSPSAADALERAGLRDVLPHQKFKPADRAVGSGIAARYPMDELELTGPSTFEQPSVRVRLDDRTSIEVVAVHPVPPVTMPDDWRADLRALPPATPMRPLRILAGDFNATEDHAELRRLLDTGYVDAAAQRGKGLTATWPQRRLAPSVTLDHVLVDARAAVDDFLALDVPGSDHRAVLASIRLP